MNRQRHYCYRVENLVNGKYYIGKRTCYCNPANDPYFGSGKNIRRAIKKYGLENFKKTILAEFDTEEEAYLCEAELVTEKTLLDPMCYNLQQGGIGGQRGAIYLNRGTEMTRVMPDLVDEYLQKGWQIGWTEEMRKVHLHKEVSEETRRKISEVQRKLYENQSGHTAGKVKVSNEDLQESKYILIKDLENYLKNGWKTGSLLQTKQRKAEKRTGEITVTDGIQEKHISVLDLDSYIKKGWYRGLSIESKRKKSEASKGKRMSKDAREKMSKAKKGKPSPSKGMVYITNRDGKIKRVYVEELQQYCQQGWQKGRIFNRKDSPDKETR